MAYAGKKTNRLSESALATLPLLLYLGVSIALMVADHRQGYGRQAREHLAIVTEPFWWLASAPTRLFRATSEELSLRSRLQAENVQRRQELDVAIARIHRLNAVADENQRLRQLLGGTRGYNLNVRMASILDIDLDPFRQRLVLDAGSDAGVQLGQALIDSGGVLGQVVEVTKHRATALLVTDPEHAVPVQVARSGLRTIAYGTGHTDQLILPHIPQSADVRRGDVLITSGIGGRFPAGFPVGKITAVRADKLRLFVIADAEPAAHLERGNEVLLISNLPAVLDMGPPAPALSPAPPAAVPAPVPSPATKTAATPATTKATTKPTAPPASRPTTTTAGAEEARR